MKELLRQHRPRLCFVGPMVGCHPGYVTTQGLVLSRQFAKADYPVIATSSTINRYLRLIDITLTLIRMRKSVDILSLEVYGGNSFVVEDVASFLGKLFGFKIAMVLHGGDIPHFVEKFPRWSHRVLARADVLVTPSTYLARALTQHGLQSQIIPNVIELDAYPYRERSQINPRLLWMRTFHPVWNPAMAIRTLHKLKKHVPEASLVMAGQDKGMQSEMLALASSLGIADAVQFPGFLNMEGKLREGDAADIFISTSTTDNMPVAIIEACAMGLPVVTTRVGGIPDLLIEGETGLFVESGDDDAMVNAILRLLRDPVLTQRLSTNGRKLALRSSWSEVRKQWEQLFDETLRVRPQGNV